MHMTSHGGDDITEMVDVDEVTLDVTVQRWWMRVTSLDGDDIIGDESHVWRDAHNM